MQITVDIPEDKLTDLVKQRFDELFSGDARYRETGVRDLVRNIVDQAAVQAVRQALEAIADKLPDLASKAVTTAVEVDIANAAKRGLACLKKLYVGFDPSKLTDEQRAWLECQITKAAKQQAPEVTK